MTFFADVTGDGKADAIAVGYDLIRVRESCCLGTGYMFDDTRAMTESGGWTNEPYYGPFRRPPYWGVGTFFADVTGDGTADAIVVDYNTVTVRRSCIAEGLDCRY